MFTPWREARRLRSLQARSVKWHGALYSPDDGRAEPHMAVAAIAAAARRRGARLLKPCAVRGLETAGGRVSGVVTERGPIACDTVVVAAASGRVFSSAMPASRSRSSRSSTPSCAPHRSMPVMSMRHPE